MSEYLKQLGQRMGGHQHRYECSACGSIIDTSTHTNTITYCWKCGVKFSPQQTSKPTPGPWTIDAKNWNAACSWDINILGPDSYLVAYTTASCREETMANARLIAAAPKLLDACKDAFNFHAGSIEDPPALRRDKLVAILESAIEAAEGK